MAQNGDGGPSTALAKVNQGQVIIVILSLLLVMQLSKHNIRDYLLSEPFSRFRYPLEVSMPVVVDAVLKGQNPWAQPVNQPKHPFVLNPDTKCRSEDGADENVFLLLLIKSRVSHFEQRQMVRRTWALETGVPYVSVKRVFLLGVEPGDRTVQHRVGMEHQDNNDVLQQYFADAYFNNTLKIMMGLQWAMAHCQAAQFIAFFDDDYYVNTIQLVRYLQAMPPIEYTNTMVTSVWKNAAVLRGARASNDWALTRQEYPYCYFPPYPTAGSFIMHFSAAQRVHIASRYTQYLRFDDVFLGIVSRKLRMRLLHNGELHFTPLPYSPFRYEQVLAVHGFDDVELLYKVWKEQYQLAEAKRRNKIS